MKRKKPMLAPRCRLLPLAVLAVACAGAAPPAGSLRTYDVSDLICKPGGKTGLDNVEEVVALVVQCVGPKRWSATQKGGNTLEVVNGTRLEVRASARQHAEVADVLASLRRMLDVAVDVRAELRAVERAFFDKELARRLGPVPGAGVGRALPLGEKLEKAVRKHSALVKSGELRLANGRAATVLSLRKAFTYVAVPPKVAKGPEEVYRVGFTGLVLKARAVVSADRRYVNLRITQTTTDLLAVRRQPLGTGAARGKQGTVEVPHLDETTSAKAVTVGDGIALLVPVHARHARARGRGKVLVVVVRPEIYIKEEEEAKKRQPGKD
jgi:hypothetical protein